MRALAAWTKDTAVKRGTFKIAADLSHAKAVVDLTDYFRAGGVPFATQGAFVKALSQVLRVPECDARVFKARLVQAPALMQKRTNTEGFLDELEGLYNYGAKGKRLALKFGRRKSPASGRAASAGAGDLPPGRGHVPVPEVRGPRVGGLEHLMPANHFIVLKVMAEESPDIRLAPLANIIRIQKTKAGTQVTIGVEGDLVSSIYLGKFVGGLILADKEQFNATKARLEAASA